MSSQIEEHIPGGYPVTPQHEDANIEYNAENSNTVENKDENNSKIKDMKNETKNDIENKPANDVENKPANDVENKSANDVKNKSANDVENKSSNDVENKSSNDVKNKSEHDKPGNDVENKPENKELENKENIAKSFPLKFEPNPSMKPTDENNVTKATTNKGSSALGGIGINPATMLGLGSDSPPHPFYQDKSKESKESDEPKTFDLNGDYNEQKEKEQLADRQKPKDERIDLGVKPLGNQPLPSPYKPEGEGADRSVVHKQTEGSKGEMTPPGKTTAVHPENQNVDPKITKKDKINATIGKAVGIFKQKIGKLVKNENMAAKGSEKREEADKTKELAEVQKKMNEF